MLVKSARSMSNDGLGMAERQTDEDLDIPYESLRINEVGIMANDSPAEAFPDATPKGSHCPLHPFHQATLLDVSAALSPW